MLSFLKDIDLTNTHCPMYHLLDLLWKKWTLFILIILFEWEQSFNSLTKKLNNINGKTLTERLDMLVIEWYIHRQVSESKPLKVTYTLTNEWRELTNHIIKIWLWRRQKVFNISYKKVRVLLFPTWDEYKISYLHKNYTRGSYFLFLSYGTKNSNSSFRKNIYHCPSFCRTILLICI